MNERQWARLSDGELIAAAQKGEEPAFEALFYRYQKRVFALLYGMLSSQGDAADLTQEVFVRAYRDLAKLRAEGVVYSWLRTTAVRLGIDLMRRRSHVTFQSLEHAFDEDSDTQTRDIEDWTHHPDRRLQASLREDAVNAAIQSLSDEHRAVVVMHHLDDMSVEEISRLLEVPVGTVKSRLARAREMLRRKLASLVEVI